MEYANLEGEWSATLLNQHGISALVYYVAIIKRTSKQKQKGLRRAHAQRLPQLLLAYALSWRRIVQFAIHYTNPTFSHELPRSYRHRRRCYRRRLRRLNC